MPDHDNRVKDHYAAKYELRKVVAPEDVRERQIRDLQAKLLRGHADFEEGGAGAPTQARHSGRACVGRYRGGSWRR